MENHSRIAVFGASGGVGGNVVRQALDAGHHVTAIIRESAAFELTHSALDVVRVPGLTDPTPLIPGLNGVRAVISGVGPRGPRGGPVASTATHSILGAMEAVGISRFVAVSAVHVGPIPDGESFLNRHILLPLISSLLRDLHADLVSMEQEIRRSQTEWTIIRPPRLVNKSLTRAYRRKIGGNVPRGYTISRANVAHAMLAALNDPKTIRQPVGVAD